ncbi:MAG: ion channel [Nitrospinales bacterium]
MSKLEWPKFGFHGLLICLVLVLLVAPFLQKSSPTLPILSLLLTGALFFSVYAFIQDKRVLLIASIIAAPTFFANWISYFLDTSTSFLIKDFFSALFFCYISINILLGIFRQKTISSDLIYGSICVYLLIGLAWAFVYSAIETLNPGSFEILINYAKDPSQIDRQATLSLFVYYSYVTLTTLGFGDITPVTPPAQSISILEALTGQFYLVILVARLVGNYLANTKGHN